MPPVVEFGGMAKDLVNHMTFFLKKNVVRLSLNQICPRDSQVKPSQSDLPATARSGHASYKTTAGQTRLSPNQIWIGDGLVQPMESPNWTWLTTAKFDYTVTRFDRGRIWLVRPRSHHRRPWGRWGLSFIFYF